MEVPDHGRKQVFPLPQALGARAVRQAVPSGGSARGRPHDAPADVAGGWDLTPDALDLDAQAHAVADERQPEGGAELAALDLGVEFAAANLARRSGVGAAGEEPRTQRQRLAHTSEDELAAHLGQCAAPVEVKVLRDEVGLGEVLRRQQVGLAQAAVDDRLVRVAAGIGSVMRHGAGPASVLNRTGRGCAEPTRGAPPSALRRNRDAAGSRSSRAPRPWSSARPVRRSVAPHAPA